MGIAKYTMNEPQEALVKRTNDAMYQDKNNGRNQVVTQPDIP